MGHKNCIEDLIFNKIGDLTISTRGFILKTVDDIHPKVFADNQEPFDMLSYVLM